MRARYFGCAMKGETTRRVKKCYPPAKDIDRKPIPNELSQLIFYLQAHRLKISRAANLLYERSDNFAKRNKTGHLIVSGLIINEIVAKLPADFSLYEEQTLNIIEIFIKKGTINFDTDLLEVAHQIFTNYTKRNDGLKFLGNNGYSNLFISVISDWSQLAIKSPINAKILAVSALNSVAKSRSLESNVGAQAVTHALPGILTNLPTDAKQYENVLENENKDMTKDIQWNATIALRSFLDSNSYRHTSLVVKSVLSWLVSLKTSNRALVFANIVKFVPPQNRYLVLKDVVVAMLELTEKNEQTCIFYSECFNALLTADFTKVDLSAVDVLQQLQRVQHRFINSQLVPNRLCTSIEMLAQLNIYPGQCCDMVSAILGRYKPVQILQQPVLVTVNDLKDLIAVLKVNTSQPVVQGLTHSSFDSTQHLLLVNHHQPVSLYTTAFQMFLSQNPPYIDLTTKRGTLIFRNLCSLLLEKIEPFNFVAVYYCLVAHIEFSAKESHLLLPWLFKITENNEGTPTQQVCRSSVVLAALLAVFKAKNRTEPADVLFNFISNRVEEKQWLLGVQYPLVDSAIDTIPSVKRNGISFETTTKSYPSVDELKLTEGELNLISDPPFELDARIDPEEQRTVRSSASSVNKMRSVSIQSNAPSIADSQVLVLRKRQTEILTARQPTKSKAKSNSPKMIAMTPDMPSLSLLIQTACLEIPQGTLTID